jgi:hypothetical protein
MDCWHHEIERAHTEADVVNRARDYLFLWSPRELEPLTLGWRELRIETVADLECMKSWLTEGLAGALAMVPEAAQLRELKEYLWHAAIRIGEIRGTVHGPQASIH